MNSNNGNYGIHFPVLNIDACTEDSFVLPSCCVTMGTKIVLRADIHSENLAAQLYAYIIRILYGEEGVKIGSSPGTHV